MSPRKNILRQLEKSHRSQPGQLTRARDLSGFDPEDPKHTKAMNQLLKDRLINGMKAEDGGMALQLNSGNIAAVKKALRPWYLSPAFWAAALVLGGLGTGLLLTG